MSIVKVIHHRLHSFACFEGILSIAISLISCYRTYHDNHNSQLDRQVHILCQHIHPGKVQVILVALVHLVVLAVLVDPFTQSNRTFFPTAKSNYGELHCEKQQ